MRCGSLPLLALAVLATAGAISLVLVLRKEVDSSPSVRRIVAAAKRVATQRKPTKSTQIPVRGGSGRARGIGGRLVVGLQGQVLDERTRRALRDGSIAGLILLPHNLQSLDQVRRLTADARRAAEVGGHPTPILCIDQEGGRVDRLRKLPGVKRQRAAARLASRGDAEVEHDASEVGKVLVAIGLNVNFAPNADLAAGAGIIGDRSYGTDPAQVVASVRSAVRGYQSAGIQAVIKHYPGHGLTRKDTHRTLPVVRVSEGTFARHEGVFKLAMAADPGGVMLGHFIVPAVDARLPASLSPAFVRRLRQKVGDAPITFTDSGSMEALYSFGSEVK